MIRANWIENFQQTIPYINRTISTTTLELVKSWVDKRLGEDPELYRNRITDGFIRECDGDLHSENICLNSRIHIFDCIEFNEKFRNSDTAADVAFLIMDLENHGKHNLADIFIDEYIAASGDRNIKAVLPLYLVNRAFIRGKVESFRLDDPGIPFEDKNAALKRASRYFRLARGYILREKFPFSLIMTCAPTGSGKTSIAAEIAFQFGFDYFSTDIIRKKLAGISPADRCTHIYTSEWNRITYNQLEKLARERLKKGCSVLVDGTFMRKDTRQPFIDMATEYGCSLFILRPVLTEKAVKQRLKSRASEPLSVSDGTWDIYQQQTFIFEEPDEKEGKVIRLDAHLPVEEIVEAMLKEIGMI
jgi:predicted kinase